MMGMMAMERSFAWGDYTWTEMTSNTSGDLEGVWGSSASDIFAVGEDGVIVHYDGNPEGEWENMPISPSRPNSLPQNYKWRFFDIWGSSPTNVFAVGYGLGGAIYHYDGDSWTEMKTPFQPTNRGMSFDGIWGNSATNVFVVGSGGAILHYNGETWSKMSNKSSYRFHHLNGVWGSSANDVFAVGNNGNGTGGTILHYDGSEWKEQKTTTEYLRGVWGTSSNNVFAFGRRGTILHYDGEKWTEQSSGTSGHLLNAWGSSEDNVLAVLSSSGQMSHYNGSHWKTRWKSDFNEIFEDIWGVRGDVFVVGWSGTILHGHDDSIVNVAQASCQLYAVHDEKRNDSQFFTVSLDDLTVSELGPMYKGHDIESLAIHPETNMIYAASGDDVTNGKPGHFYRVDGETGKLIPVGSTGFNEIEDLAFGPDGTLYAWAKGEGLITIDLATGKGTLVFPDKTPIEGLTLKKNEGNVFFGAVGTDLLRYDGATDTLEVICPNGLLGETEALEITPDGLITADGLLLIGTHKVPFGLHAFDAQTCQVIEADETLSNQYNDVEGIAVPVAACSSTSSSCAALAQEDLQVFEAIFMEPFVLYMAIRSMVVVDYDITGEWPIPLSTSITPPTGNYTAGFVSGPLHLEATMRSQAELEAALAAFNLDKANKACLAEVAGKVIRFNFNPSTRIWSCSVNLPNGVPPQHLDLFPMKCD